MESIKTEDFVSLLVAILSALPPDSRVCRAVKVLAESSSWGDYMEANYSPEDSWENDKQQLIQELLSKFGEEIDMEEVIAEWEKQADL
ncbi:MAG: hypothetical protein ACKO1W_09750 [Microcystaceae cyanobacterium]